MFGDTVAIAGKTITLASTGASLVLDADAKLDGAMVLLNCGGGAAAVAAERKEGSEGMAVILVKSAEPLVGMMARLQMPDGKVEEREVPEDGTLRIPLPEGSPPIQILGFFRDSKLVCATKVKS